jgi:hypothetical protein
MRKYRRGEIVANRINVFPQKKGGLKENKEKYRFILPRTMEKPTP